MIFKAGQKWRTRCGDIVTIKEVIKGEFELYPIQGYGNASWTLEGHYHLDEDRDGDLPFTTEYDLIELVEDVPEVHVAYINIYPSRRSHPTKKVHHTAATACNRSIVEADERATSDRIACIRVEYTEGQFDD